MSLARLSDELAWPDPVAIMQPPGAGQQANLALARKKIQSVAARLEGGRDTEVGLLAADPKTNATQAPLAIVCAFPEPPPNQTLAEIQRLAWNFSHAPLLLTVDDRELRAFSCSEPPSRDLPLDLDSEITEARYVFDDMHEAVDDTADKRLSLHWLELATGSFLSRHNERFKRRNRADNLLLDNLSLLRKRLNDDGLPFETIHDLLARTIFVQFLFDRKDANGVTALNEERLAKLCEQEVLSEEYDSFADILHNHADTYSLFGHLDDRFNGDLFPEIDGTVNQQREKDIVRPEHLHVLSEFISGSLSLRSGQRSLWPLYSFDAIPLEFISSIYESFVEHDGQAIYTPSHLVDFVLDEILPWNETNWDVKILDPSCGSGIFLVKALHRLVHRWKLHHGDLQARIPIADLRRILEYNLSGIDKDPHAIRVASFSLYLAMCDEIDPKHYWSSVRFPTLQGVRLANSDFFDDSVQSSAAALHDLRYDMIIGNAPWGKNTVTDLAREWAHEQEWPVSYGDIGPLFLAKAATLCKSGGVVSLLQPAGTLLTNRSEPARLFRKRMFKTLGVREIVNLSALRFGLFREAVGPAALVTLTPEITTDAITYVCPKPMHEEGVDSYRVVVDQYDVHEVNRKDAVEETKHWTVLFWGTQRDLALIRKLEELSSLLNYELEGKLARRQGVIRGNRRKEQQTIVGRFMLDAPDFPEGIFLSLVPDTLPRNQDSRTDDRASTDFSAFEPSQMLIKTAWRLDEQRFRAVVNSSNNTGVLCSDSYLTTRAAPSEKYLLEDACVMLNSKLAVYYLLGHSGRFATYRPEPQVIEILATPIVRTNAFSEIRSFEELDHLVFSAAGLKPSERALIDHAVDLVLPDLKAGTKSNARERTKRGVVNGLREYCDWFLKILATGLPTDSLSATVFEEAEGDSRLPVRYAEIRLAPGDSDCEPVSVERVSAAKLSAQIAEVYESVDRARTTEEICPNVVRVFGFTEFPTGRVPTVFIAKSDQARYWTPAMALRDADDVSAELLRRGQLNTS